MPSNVGQSFGKGSNKQETTPAYQNQFRIEQSQTQPLYNQPPQQNQPQYQNQFQLEQANQSKQSPRQSNIEDDTVKSNGYQNQFQLEQANKNQGPKIQQFQQPSQNQPQYQNQFKKEQSQTSPTQFKPPYQNQFRKEQSQIQTPPAQFNPTLSQTQPQYQNQFKKEQTTQAFKSPTKPNLESPTSVYQNQFKKDIHSSQGDLGRRVGSGEIGDSQGSLSGVDCKELARKFNCFNASQVSAFYQEFLVAGDEGSGK